VNALGGWALEIGFDVMVEIVAMGFALLSAGIFAAHAYDMVRGAGARRA